MSLALGSGACEHDTRGTITVLAAASLTEVVTEIAREFEAQRPGVRVECSFAGSQLIAAQLLTGARADVFLSADAAQMDRVAALVGEPVAFASGRLVVIAGAGSGYPDVAAALTGAPRIALAGPVVPAGRLAEETCARLGVWDSVRPRVVTREDSVRGVLMRVVMGEADVGIVYATDVAAAPGGSVVALAIPDQSDERPVYLGAVCLESDHPEAASAFLGSLTTDPAARATLRSHGFEAP
ncbi:MAG: molybdate ABC transporter substrate-binding protein [Phycisphaeraceae bacterium]|nr:molybdate ABC transporter substrate-binding protein [Phycisphaeraceae bacterium]